MPKRLMSTDDLYWLKTITDCEISPDGNHTVFCINNIDKKTQKKYQHIYVAATDGSRLRRFTTGEQVDRKPKWSPDGKSIAFLSNRKNKKAFDLYLIPFDGGEARRISDISGEITTFEWSPDGEKIVCCVQLKDEDELLREKDPDVKELGTVCRRITRVFYKLESKGYLRKQRTHLWIVDVTSGKARQITNGDVYDEYSPAWSPDGGSIVYCSNVSQDPDLDPDAVDLFVIPSSGGGPKRIETPIGWKSYPAWSPDGKWIAYVGRRGRGEWWRHDYLWAVKSDGTAAPWNLTEHFDVNVCCWTINDVIGHPELTRPAWSPKGDRLYFQVSRHGSTQAVSVDFAEKPDMLHPVYDEKGVLGDFSFDRSHTRMAFVFADLENPGEVYVLDLKKNKARRLTSENRKMLNRVKLGKTEEIWFKGPSGDDIQGWILTPPDFNPQTKYPAILEIHGGPHVQYGSVFMHEFQLLAARGYVVFYCNPRGSTGYGENHAKAVWNNWGGPDYADISAWADHVQKKQYVDKSRMGVTGGSYGGYMTNWIIGSTDRFKAAVTQRSVSNFISMYGTSDFNWTFEQELGGKPPWDDMDNFWRQSPIRLIGQAKTPTLIIHSEQDMRCPIEQGEQVFVALKRLGVDAELVLFPDESHELSRAGRTDRRIERLNHITRWFDKYLK